MKKIIFSLCMMALSVTSISAQDINYFWPQAGQNANWSTNLNNELVFAGPYVAGSSVATMFGLGDVIKAPWTGINIKFEATIPSAGNFMLILGWNAAWGGQGICMNFNVWEATANKNFTYANPAPTQMSSNVPAYQALFSNGEGITPIEVNVSATGLITTTVAGLVLPTTYQADLTVLANSFIGFIPNAAGFTLRKVEVTQNNLTNKFFWSPGTGLNQSKNTNVSVYPSPSKGDFTIASDAVGRKFQVTNLLGQNIKSGIINSNNQKLDLTNESAGNYFVTIEGENGKVVKSIIKN